MGDRVGERLQVLVRSLQVGRALPDAGFKAGVQRPDLGFGFALRGLGAIGLGDVACRGYDPRTRPAGSR